MLVAQSLYKYDKVATYPQCKTASVYVPFRMHFGIAIRACSTLLNVLTSYKFIEKKIVGLPKINAI